MEIMFSGRCGQISKWAGVVEAVSPVTVYVEAKVAVLYEARIFIEMVVVVLANCSRFKL